MIKWDAIRNFVPKPLNRRTQIKSIIDSVFARLRVPSTTATDFNASQSNVSLRGTLDDTTSDLHSQIANYWTTHNVTLHHQFASSQESLEYLEWRNDQYHNYIDLMPVKGHDGKVILDHGCGPGHDLVGFGTFSSPLKLIGTDVSPPSLAEAKKRLALHGIDAEIIHIPPNAATLPFESQSMDYIHCSGVLHHVAEPEHVLAEFRRILKPTGQVGIMVYNYNSLWMHLYVAYIKQIVEGRYVNQDLRTAFGKLTDGEDCPVSRAYTMSEFIELSASAGFATCSSGAAISMYEMSMFPRRFEAIMDPRLRRESRKFLQRLKIDGYGYPTYNGSYAGVDGCYLLAPR